MTTTASPIVLGYVLAFLETMRRIPDDIILTMFCELENVQGGMDDCFLGKLLQTTQDANPHPLGVANWNATIGEAARMFGGTEMEWKNIFWGVTKKDFYTPEGGMIAEIEEAFALRLDEIVGTVEHSPE
jgi:hypothetical protein